MKSIQLVTWQIVAIICILITGPLVPSRPGSIVLIVFGILIGSWGIIEIHRRSRFSVLPEVHPEGKLVTSGPFRIVRNPMYLALLVAAAGYVLDELNLYRIGFFIFLTVILVRKIEIEERQLLRRFPEYKDYAKRTSRLLPFIW
ncbi:MAG: isoprenylcysteine carboxylmethyltransferase family protein [Patescibacteria group bacterium]|nr:isoprenylcysteine carboxylmethyltransferase family protein [Patescibacteria group bacterium]